MARLAEKQSCISNGRDEVGQGRPNPTPLSPLSVPVPAAQKADVSADRYPADAPLIMSGIKGVPFAPEVDLKPSVEIHRRRIRRHTDITQVTVHIARWDVHGTAQRDGEMGEVTAYASPLLVCLKGGARRARALIVEDKPLMREVTDGLDNAGIAR